MPTRCLLPVAVLLMLAAPSRPAGGQTDQLVPLPDQALAYIPASSGIVNRMPLLILLHGAGQRPETMVEAFRAEADQLGMILLAPKSADATWDVVRRARSEALIGSRRAGQPLRYTRSPDGARIAAALASLEKHVRQHSAILLAGFSDGASFALALGTDREQPYSAVLAMSPGIAVVASRPARGRPIMVTHGRADPTLAFGTTRSEIVPALRRAGLKVIFQPFQGGHALPNAPITAWRSALPEIFPPAANSGTP